MKIEEKINIKEKSDVPADASLPTKYGIFRIRVFHEEETGLDHVALTLGDMNSCLLYTSPSPRDISGSRMPSSA